MSEQEQQTAFVYRLFVNVEGTVRVRVWDLGAEVATRESPEEFWGPPRVLVEVKA